MTPFLITVQPRPACSALYRKGILDWDGIGAATGAMLGQCQPFATWACAIVGP